ncbi:hypothetical protein DBB34_15990 [Sphaerisporangium cinnabarinum]|nr:hypothetical protein DBB34_15990 [Sphaerisporangium cinnabarinum]
MLSAPAATMRTTGTQMSTQAVRRYRGVKAAAGGTGDGAYPGAGYPGPGRPGCPGRGGYPGPGRPGCGG